MATLGFCVMNRACHFPIGNRCSTGKFGSLVARKSVVPSAAIAYAEQVLVWGMAGAELRPSEDTMSSVPHHSDAETSDSGQGDYRGDGLDVEIVENGPWTGRNDVLLLSLVFDYLRDSSATLLGTLDSSAERGKWETGTKASAPVMVFAFLLDSAKISGIESLFPLVFSHFYSADHLYIIHVDSKAEVLRAKVRVMLPAAARNVLLIPEELSIKGLWGDISIVQAEAVCWLHALAMSDSGAWPAWRHFMVLSGTTVPLFAVGDMPEELDRIARTMWKNLNKTGEDGRHDHRASFIAALRSRHLNLDPAGAHCANRFTQLQVPQVEPLTLIAGLPRHSLWESYGSALWSGFQWSVLHVDFIRTLLRSRGARKLLWAFRNSVIPDEGFMISAFRVLNLEHTGMVLGGRRAVNDPEHGHLVEHSPTFVKWTRRGYTMDEADVDMLAVNRKDCIVARKVTTRELVCSVAKKVRGEAKTEGC
jgi:hypothetical protein